MNSLLSEPWIIQDLEPTTILTWAANETPGDALSIPNPEHKQGYYHYSM